MKHIPSIPPSQSAMPPPEDTPRRSTDDLRAIVGDALVRMGGVLSEAETKRRSATQPALVHPVPEGATLCRLTLDRLAEVAEAAEARYWATWRAMRRGMSPENVALLKNAERAMHQARAAFMAEEMYQKLMGPPA